MATNTQTEIENKKIESDPTNEGPKELAPEDDEFKITVKKLDFAVRPRGVLAE
jgi:hypothetical protein